MTAFTDECVVGGKRGNGDWDFFLRSFGAGVEEPGIGFEAGFGDLR